MKEQLKAIIQKEAERKAAIIYITESYQKEYIEEFLLSHQWLIDAIPAALQGEDRVQRNIMSLTDVEILKVITIMLGGKEPDMCEIHRSSDSEYISATYKIDKPYQEEYDSVHMVLSIHDFGGGVQLHNNWNYHNSKGVGTTDAPLHNAIKIVQYLQDINIAELPSPPKQ